MKGEKMDKEERRRRLASNPYEAMYTANISDGYLTLPLECLKDLNSKSIFITFSREEGMLCLYSPESFENVRHNLDCLNLLDPKVRLLKRRIIGRAVEIEINDENQVYIHPEFLTELGFGTNQETIENETFSVVILKYSYAILIVSSSLYEEIYG